MNTFGPNTPAVSRVSETASFLYKFFWRCADRALRKRLFFVGLVVFIAIALNVAYPIFFKQVVHSMRVGESDRGLYALLFFCIGWTLSGISMHLREFFFYKVLRGAIFKSAVEIFAHLLNLPYGFHTERNLGYITSAIGRAARALDDFSAGFFFVICPSFFEVLAASIIIYTFCGFLYAAILLMTLVLFFIYTYITSRSYAYYHAAYNEAEGEAAGHALDTLLNYRAVKFSNTETFETEQYKPFLKKARTLCLKADYRLEGIHIGQISIVGIGFLLSMYLAFKSVMANTMALSTFILLQNYFLQLASPLKVLGVVFREMRQSFIDMQGVIYILRQPREKVVRAAPKITDGSVRLSRVSFTYPEGTQALQDVSLTIKNGQKIAIVGRSGSGKSTLSRVLVHLYPDYNGDIFLSDHNIHNLNLQVLRSAITIVPQEPVLLNRTIFENIAYGHPRATQKAVEQAAQFACIHERIQCLELRYKTLVGEGGAKLSGGERQRIGLARALLQDAQVYVFDESTSYLDFLTEKKIMQMLKKKLAKKTCLFIAHRLTSITDTDHIFVMEKGRIVEKGTHQDLLNRKGAYTQLWESNLGNIVGSLSNEISSPVRDQRGSK